jgi:hypothetical protein
LIVPFLLLAILKRKASLSLKDNKKAPHPKTRGFPLNKLFQIIT